MASPAASRWGTTASSTAASPPRNSATASSRCALMNRRGEPAEELAAAFLEREGLRILERNYRCKLGEIDLVAKSGATTIFVEVRARASEAFGGAAASITAAKRARIIRAARHYLTRHKSEPACRFDVVLVRGAEQRIEWLPGAFCE